MSYKLCRTGCNGEVTPSLPLPTAVVEDGSLFCPDTAAARWSFRSCGKSSSLCTTGTFSFDGSLPSDNSSCFGPNSTMACAQIEGDSSALYVCVASLTSESGTLEFTYTSDGGSSQSFTVDFGEL